VVGRHNLGRVEIGDPEGVFELLSLLLTTILAGVRPRQELVLEHLLLRHQLAVLARPTQPDRALGFVLGTSCCGSWLAGSAPAGASTWRSSRLIR
jgi:hypothetical protein